MKITAESELMQNQKHAVVMDPDLAFEVLQSQDGDSLFFSIGSDHVFYLTREVSATATGWNKLDLSSALSSQHGGAPVAAKTFSVAQNGQTLAIDLALVLTVSGADYLYLSLGNANTDASWANGVTWTLAPFDAGTAPSPLTIADVLTMNLPASGGAVVENIFVDILRTPGDALQLLNRYYIAPGKSPQWNLHLLAEDLAAGSISSCLGQRTNDPVPGIYTFGTIGGTQELLFTPQFNYFRPTVPPNPARLTLPAGASAVASAANAAGVSNLFVAGTAGLFLFTPDNQADQATPIQIVSNSLLAGASALAACSTGGRTAVWGLAPQGNLFSVMCTAGSESDPAAWSTPVPLVSGAAEFAFFLNIGAGNNVLFAQLDGQDLVQLTQDPVTTDWFQRSILLPSTSADDVAVYNSFTTHVQITDDNGVAAPNTAVGVTATSPVSAYLNDVYYHLSPTVPVSTTTDATGVLTVVQETQSLAAVCFQVVLTATPAVVANVNPMTNAMAKLSTIQDGSDLAKVQVTNEDGSQQALVPSTVSSDDTDAAAQSLKQFVTISTGLPQDGSRQAASTVTASAAATTTVPRMWGVSLTAGSMAYREGDDTARVFGLKTTPALMASAAGGSGAFGSVAADIKIAAGDFFSWIKRVVHDIDSFVVHEAEGVYHFFATVAGKIYDVLLDCFHAIAHAVEYVLNKIKVGFEDAIKWLGFIFNWNDVLRTHGALKNIINQYLQQCVSELGTARAQLQTAFTSVESYIDAWAGIPNNIPSSLTGSSLDSSTSSSQPGPGQNSPQSNWGIHHLKSNATSGSTTAQPFKGITGNAAAILQPLGDALEREKEVFQAAAASFKSDIIDQIHQLSFEQLIEKVIAIIADALLESVENVLLAAIDVLTALVDGVIDALNATIEIPVISWLYKKIAHADLSLLDLTCLVAAIPITVGYKLITNTAPFPDNPATTALVNAGSFAAIQQLYGAAPSLTGVSAMPTAVKAAAGTSTAAAVATISTPDNKILVLTGGIASAVGAVLLCFFSPLKQKFPESKVFPVVNGLSYLLYAAPDVMGQIPDLQKSKWWAVTNQVITDLMIVKAMVDMGVALTATDSAAQEGWNPVSPWLDFAGNIVWQVPTSAALFDPENQNTAGILGFFGGTCFDCNGVLSPAIADDSEPISWAFLVGLASFFNLAYGALSCAASVETYKP